MFVFWYMHFQSELKQIRRVYQTPVSGSETYDSDTPTLWRKPVSTINTSSMAYSAGLSPYEINTRAYGPVVASAIGVVYARHRHRLAFIQLSGLERARDELNVEFGRLQLEQATVAEATRIDQIARVRLGMKSPEAADIVVVRP